MTWLRNLRLEEAKKRPVLKDIRALHHDGIGVSVRVLRLIENDPNYLAKPEIYANIVLYFQKNKLINHVCKICPIYFSVKTIKNDLHQKSSNISSYNKDLKKLNSVKKLVKKKKRNSYILQNSRFRYSIRENRYYTIEDISMMTLIPVKKICKMEKSNYVLDDFHDVNTLLRTYHDPILSTKVCNLCPVRYAADEVRINLNKKEEI